ncbi:transcriptional adapter ADA2 [Chloropicon primus]|uniref:Transcriptional adapter n=1 Tax=Chloropicon primus TaxID=1764295 RepID=A0A5B8MW70_9CHLO|nr:transcriptional adapter 2 [Chloropicon primus]UPR03810.1 transcriptional adapter ADA2 [Chloropicon primus]|eukprot:QDZ24601.1 transcriptional adapter 2 [Chloropicon primus]
MEEGSTGRHYRTKRRRALDGGLLTQPTRGSFSGAGKKKALYNCKYCGKDLSHTLRVRSVGPSSGSGEEEDKGGFKGGATAGTTTDLCLECFSVGVEPWPHKRTHAYRVVEDLSVPIFDPEWGCDEELLLLEALEIYGPGNWSEIADHVGRKDKFECRNHYFELYINSPKAPLPVVPTQEQLQSRVNKRKEEEAEGKSGLKVASGKQEEAEWQGGAGSDTPDQANDSAGERSVEGSPLEGKAGKGEAQQQVDAARGEGDPNTLVFKGLSPQIRARAEGNQIEITGYNVKRDDFEPENDNDAEVALAELEIRNEDSKEERALKLEMLRIYHVRQRERYEKRKFVLDRHFLNVRKQQLVEKRRTREEKEIHACMRVFARFQTPDEHDELVGGICKEQRLRKRISELKEYRKMGILTLAEAEFYEQDKRRRESERERVKQMESYLQQRAYKSSKQERANRYFNRKSSVTDQEDGNGTSVVSGPGSSRELQGLRIEDPGKTEKIPNNLAMVTKQMEPADLTSTPYLDLLTKEEQDVCSSLRMLPVQYLSIKTGMVSLSKSQGGLDKQDAREFFKVDVYKLNRIHDYLVSKGDITAVD